MTATRQYTPIWETIKRDGYCELSAHRAHHPRIRKALRKEKDLDLGYKLECLERTPPVRVWVRVTQTGSVLKFRMVTCELITVDSV